MRMHRWVAVAAATTAMHVASSSSVIAQGSPDSAATVTTLVPATVNQSTTALDISVRGRGFSDKSKVRVDGTPRSTTFVSGTELRATLSTNDVATMGSRAVSVFNPGGGNSNSIQLSIAAVTAVAPAPPPPPADIVRPIIDPIADLILTATSASGAVATLVAPRATDNSGKVSVSVTPYALGVPVTFPVGTHTATYKATDPSGNFTTVSQRIIVAAPPVAPAPPAPAADTEPPRFELQTLPNLLVSATSSTGAVVTPVLPRATDNSGVVTVKATSNNMPFNGPVTLSIGSHSILYTATDPSGNKATLSNIITVGPQPVSISIASLVPAGSLPGGGKFPVRVNGSGFKGNMIVRWNGSPRPTQFISSSALLASVGNNDAQYAGTARVTVFDPEIGLETPPVNFVIGAGAGAVPRITSITPTTAVVGDAPSVRVSGTDLLPGYLLRWKANDLIGALLGTKDTVATFDGSGALIGGIPGRLTGHASSLTLKLFNPGTGTESNSVTFTLTAPVQTPTATPAPTATRLVRESIESQSGVTSVNIASAPAVSVRDQNDRPMAGVPVQFSVTAGGGVITPASVVTDASGIARAASWRLGPSAGQNSVVAALTGISSLTFVAVAAAPAPMATSFQAATPVSLAGSSGSAVSQPPAVIVKDQRGMPLPGASVSFAVIAGGGTVTPAVQVTGADGIARVTRWTLGPNIAVNQLKASIANTAFATTFTAAVTSVDAITSIPLTTATTTAVAIPGTSPTYSVATPRFGEQILPLRGRGSGLVIKQPDCAVKGKKAVMGGLTGYSAMAVDMITVMCATLISVNELASAGDGGSIGEKNLATFFNRGCDVNGNVGEAVVGISGTIVNGDIRSLAIHCQHLGSNGLASGPIRKLSSAGTVEGTAFGPDLCTNGRVARAIWATQANMTLNLPGSNLGIITPYNAKIVTGVKLICDDASRP